MNIIIDTNFLIDCIKYKIDCLHEIDRLENIEGKMYFIVLDCCINELERIAQGRDKAGMNARIALDMLKKENIRIVRYHKKAVCTDSNIIEYAKENRCMVATNDKNLIKKLKADKIRVIRIRQKKCFDVI